MLSKGRMQIEAGLSRDANLYNYVDETPQVQEQCSCSFTNSSMFSSDNTFWVDRVGF